MHLYFRGGDDFHHHAAANVQMHWDFSLVGWIAVLLVFVLERVFEEGARIRDDLDAMI